MTQAPATIVRDTFTGADGTLLENHAPDIGGAWTKQVGFIGATISSNRLTGSSLFGFRQYTNAALPSADYEMSFVAHALGLSIGFMCHFIDTNNFYAAIYESGQYRITRLIGGVEVFLATLTEAAPSLPATFTLRVRKGDAFLRLIVNGVEKVATNDAAFGGGIGGLALFGAGASLFILDDFSAQMVPADVHLTAHYAPTIRLAAEPPRVPTLAASFEKTITKGAAQ
jgi:hypothetical protein